MPGGELVDAGIAAQPEPLFVELPVLVPVRAVPLSGSVVALIGEADSDAIGVICPEFLDEAVVLFAVPLAVEEGDNLRAAIDEFGSIAPAAIDGVRQRNAFRIAGVPGVFSGADLGHRGFVGKGRDYGMVTTDDIGIQSK